MTNDNAFKAGQGDSSQGLNMNPAMQNAPAAIRESYEAGWHKKEEEKKNPPKSE